ncbi:MAG: putative Ig domain-containing protein [Candidatus Poribacteria bacterium]
MRLATGGWDHTVLVWERRPGGRFRELVAHRGHESSVWSVVFSPDGSLLASASVDTTVRAWYPSGPGQLAVLAGHGATVRTVAFSPDDNLLASGGDDGAVTLWTSPVVSLNVAPRISVSKTAITVLEGAAASLVVSATDPEGDPLVFSASGAPDNATLNAQTGRFRIEPDYTQSGRYTVEFSVSDGRRGLDSVSVTVRVTAADLFRIQAGPRRVAGGETLTLTLAANGSVPDGVAIAANGLPDNASFNAARRILTFTPDLTQAGSYDVTFRVTQNGRLAEQHAVTLNVDHSDAFALTPWEPQTIDEGETLSVQADRTDNAGAATVLTASALPPNATFDAATGDLRFTPDYTQAGSYTITVRATQGGEVVQTERMRVTVVEANPFTLNPSGPQLVSEGLTRVIAVELAPAARGVVTLSAGGLPPNASFDPSTNQLSFTPAFGQIGEFTIAIQASQNGVAVQTEEILLSVGAAEAFTLDPSAPAAVAEGQSVVVRAVLSDDAPDTITVAPRALPTNASYDASTGALTFTPDYTQAGTYTITFEALQNGSPVQSKDAVIAVSDADVFALDPGTTFAIAEGDTTVVSITGDVAALNAVTFSAVGLPPNATLDLPTRRLTFSPDYTQAGVHRITIQARQNGQVVQTDDVSVTVSDVRVFSVAAAAVREIVEGAVATVGGVVDVGLLERDLWIRVLDGLRGGSNGFLQAWVSADVEQMQHAVLPKPGKGQDTVLGKVVRHKEGRGKEGGPQHSPGKVDRQIHLLIGGADTSSMLQVEGHPAGWRLWELRGDVAAHQADVGSRVDQC